MPSAGDGFGSIFSAPIEAYPHQQALAGEPFPSTPALQISPTALVFNAPNAGSSLLEAFVAIACTACGEDIVWVVQSEATWLSANIVEGQLQVVVDLAALGTGDIHSTTITISVSGHPDIPAVRLPVTVLIGQLDVLFPIRLYIPTVRRG